ncbi:MAG TPA: dephospho-CoA kinase [Syntrophales bacterium]|nr:dephospho-CoA kinase [Syntrophales bacterium]
MLNVGLTGGIASGKSTVAKMFEDKGAYLIDFDALAHFAEEPDQPAWKAVVEVFGRDILNEDETINRAKLGLIVFSDQEKLSRLNSIVHPAVFGLWRQRMGDVRKINPRAVVIADIPLLIEVRMQHLFDVVILVHASPEHQIRRLTDRNACSRKDAERRLGTQMPIDEKIPHADFVIDNRGSIEITRSVVDAVWEELVELEKKNYLSH